ncbi:hypothetical protein ABT282_07995 [Streptomyces sp. NPDC000927]|uniref:hypothetical protein n=1 Tax=Streptomyces sp. NPDC000927 TaxID=3154371 RepID=UPI00331C7FF2
MLSKRPHQVIGFHESFAYERGGTSDMLLKALISDVPTWLIPGDSLRGGHKPDLGKFPAYRYDQAHRDLQQAGLIPEP